MNLFRRFIDWVTGRYRIRDVPLRVGRLPLKNNWTLEASEDLRKLCSIDAEAELVKVMQQEIFSEITRTGQRLPLSTFEEQ